MPRNINFVECGDVGAGFPAEVFQFVHAGAPAIIASAAAGAAERMGFELGARVQPRLEAALIVLLVIVAAALFLPKGHLIAGPGAAAAGCIAAIRLYRWRLWLWRRPDLVCLGLGYGWLALGLVLYGGGIYFQHHLITALHVITVGALGTLSTGVMARLMFQHSVRQAPSLRIVLITSALLAVSVLLRASAGLTGAGRIELLWASAACWSLTYLYLALHFFGTKMSQSDRAEMP